MAERDTDSSLPSTPEGHVRTPFGVSLLRDAVRPRSWREALAQENSLLVLTPAERAMLFRVHKVQQESALRTLRQTILGEDTRRYMPERPTKDEMPHLERPTEEELAQHGKVSLDEQLSRHASIQKLTAGKDRASKEAFAQKTSRVARLKALQADAREEIDENIDHLAHLARHYAAAIHGADDPEEQDYACVVMEEMLAVAARSVVLLKQQTHPNDADRRVNAIHTVMDAVNELVDHALEQECRRLPDQVSRSRYLDMAHGILDLFFGKQANRQPI